VKFATLRNLRCSPSCLFTSFRHLAGWYRHSKTSCYMPLSHSQEVRPAATIPVRGVSLTSKS
jgi:hypothetical protein